LNYIPTTATFKVCEDDFENLIEKEGIMPAPYLARYKWVKIDNLQRFSKQEWENYIQKSYCLISTKFSIKQQRELRIID